MTEFNFTDRYQVLGIPYPDPDTMCLGDCEGIGMYPQKREWSEEAVPSARWQEAHKKAHTLRSRGVALWNALVHWDRIWLSVAFARCDGWHLITCEQCEGSGKRKDVKASE